MNRFTDLKKSPSPYRRKATAYALVYGSMFVLAHTLLAGLLDSIMLLGSYLRRDLEVREAIKYLAFLVILTGIATVSLRAFHRGWDLLE